MVWVRVFLWATIMACMVMADGPLGGANSADSATAATDPPVLIKRDVLAIYDGADEKTPDQTRIHSLLETPLNHLGYKLTFWDLKQGLPPADVTSQHAAVVTWFSDKVPNSNAYLEWATRTARQGVRFVMFGALPAQGAPGEIKRINEFLKELGLTFIAHYVGETQGSRITTRDKRIVEYERKLAWPVPGYLIMRGEADRVQSFLSVADQAVTRLGPKESVLVATSAGGGYVAANYAVNYDPNRNRMSWIIDPIAFLASALGNTVKPIPDTTTLAGRRIYFSHIDGDGWNNTMSIPGDPDAVVPTAVQTVLTELIAPFPDLPVSIGLIACDTDPEFGGTVAAQDFARQLFALPQVEVASHTHTHPYDWAFYEKYSRNRELSRLSPPSAPRARIVQPAQGQAGPFDFLTGGTTGGTEAGKPRIVYSAPTPAGAPPRYRTTKPFDLTTEITGALEASQSFAPPDRKVALYLWSGDTRPFEAAIRATRQAGVRNMNGGDSRYDSEYASLAYLRPLSRMVGRERQIFSVNSNEMIYTNDWKGPTYGGFSKLKETFDRTDKPRRLRGMNVYYHMFSADRAAGLEAVRGHLKAARAANIIPIEASRYAAIADDFFQTKIHSLGTLQWRITERGSMQTLRFDDAAALSIDFGRSSGVLGFNRHNGSLYVALDPAVAEPVVALKAVSGDGASGGKVAAGFDRAHLIESRWDVHGLNIEPCALSAKVKGYGPGQMRWGGVKAGNWHVTVGGSKPVVAVADASGTLTLTVEADARAGLDLEMRCAD